MKRSSHNIFSYIKYSIFIIAVLSMLLQSLAQTITFITDNNLELVKIGNEKDSDKEDKLEDHSDDKKFEWLFLNINNHQLDYASKHTDYHVLLPISDYSLEIPIPPPDLS